MTRLAVLALMGALLIPSAAVAQSPVRDDILAEIGAFAEILGDPVLAAGFESASTDTPEGRSALRQTVDTSRSLMLQLDPHPCWLPTFTASWDSLTLIDAALDLYETAPDAATELVAMALARQSEFSATDFDDCPSA